MNYQQAGELIKIIVISIISGVILTDILQCIKYYLVSKGRWWKKYPYQNTDSKNKTNTYPDSFLVILRAVTLSGMFISFCHTRIIKRLAKRFPNK